MAFWEANLPGIARGSELYCNLCIRMKLLDAQFRAEAYYGLNTDDFICLRCSALLQTRLQIEAARGKGRQRSLQQVCN